MIRLGHTSVTVSLLVQATLGAKINHAAPTYEFHRTVPLRDEQLTDQVSSTFNSQLLESLLCPLERTLKKIMSGTPREMSSTNQRVLTGQGPLKNPGTKALITQLKIVARK